MIGDNIRQLRKAQKISQIGLAEALGVSQATITCWENGTRKPSLDLLNRIADYFHVSTDDLLDHESGLDDQYHDLWQLREEVRRDPDRQALFSLARDADIRDVRRVLALLDALKKAGEDE